MEETASPASTDPFGPFARMWGTRGSIPVSGAKWIRHGGNTSCLEIADGGESIILDAGSGIRELGLVLAKGRPRVIHIFITHTHWDHIQGFPFFAPAYIPGFELRVYGASGFKKDLPSVFRGQLDADYFPVPFEAMSARIEFHPLNRPPLRIGPFEVSWERTHHPSVTLAFKVKASGRTMAYVSDNEFLAGYLGGAEPVGLETPVLQPHRRLVEFLGGVELLVAEAQYPDAEYRQKVGWGHSSVSNAALLTKLSGARRWIVTHHDPSHDDSFLDNKLNATRRLMSSMGCACEVRHAYDGMVELLDYGV